MVNQALANYVKEQIKKGFDTQTIRAHLIKYGHSTLEVDEAIRSLYSPEVRHIIHFSPTTLISISAIFVGLIIVSFLVFNLPSKTPEQLLDLNLESVKTTINAGNEITFISELENLGSKTRYDVNLKYEVVNLRTNDVLTFKEETRALETKGSKQINIDIPSDAETGNYILRAIATYDGQRAVATLPVKVEQGETVEPIIEEPVEEPIEEEVPEEPEEEPTSGGTSAINTFETIEKVESIAQQNPNEAEKLCKKLELQTSRDLCYSKLGEVLGDGTYCQKINDERTRDVCLINVAKITNKNQICEEVSKVSRKDNCYMNFVTGGKNDFSVCSKIFNQYLRTSCDSLKRLNELNITDVAYYESLINQSLFEFI